MAEPNEYSRRWFEYFHTGIDHERTNRAVDFVSQCAPLPHFRRIADVCCGTGRQARALASRGYLVTGIERDAGAVAQAEESGGGVVYVHADIRHYQPKPSRFDAAIVLGQSFGYFDPATNLDTLHKIAASVRKNGLIILDLWNREFFLTRQGDRNLETRSGVVRESKRMEEDRLLVRLHYPEGGREDFEWQLFTPEQMHSLADSIELDVSIVCTDFDRATTASPDNPRIQFVLERRP